MKGALAVPYLHVCCGAAAVGAAMQPRTQDSIHRYLHDLRTDELSKQLELPDDGPVSVSAADGADVEPPELQVECRALPVASIGKGRGQPQ